MEKPLPTLHLRFEKYLRLKGWGMTTVGSAGITTWRYPGDDGKDPVPTLFIPDPRHKVYFKLLEDATAAIAKFEGRLEATVLREITSYVSMGDLEEVEDRLSGFIQDEQEVKEERVEALFALRKKVFEIASLISSAVYQMDLVEDANVDIPFPEYPRDQIASPWDHNSDVYVTLRQGPSYSPYPEVLVLTRSKSDRYEHTLLNLTNPETTHRMRGKSYRQLPSIHVQALLALPDKLRELMDKFGSAISAKVRSIEDTILVADSMLKGFKDKMLTKKV